jgi:hypothetical protein
MNRSRADAKSFSRFEDSHATRQLLADAIDNFPGYRATPEPLPLAPRPREASLDPLDYNAALELRKDAEHLKHRLSGWGAGVEPLLVQVEINIFGV